MPTNTNHNLSYIKIEYILFLLFAALWFFGDSIIFRSDSMVYLKEANDLITNGDWEYRRFPFRGPVFTLITSFVLIVTDNNPVFVGLIPRLAGFLCLFFTFILVRRHFSSLAAFVTVAIMATNPLFIEMARTYHIDLMLAAITIGFLNIFSIAILKENKNMMYLAGCIYSLAFLTKEMSMLLVGLVLIVVLTSSMKNKIKYIKNFYLAVIAIVGSWAIYISSLGFHVNVILGRHVNPVANEGSKFQIYSEQLDATILDKLGIIMNGLWNSILWFKDTQGIIIGIMIITSMLILLKRSLTTRDPISIMFLLSPLCFLPFVAYWGSTVISPRQLTSFIMLAIVSCAPLIEFFLKPLEQKDQP